MRQIPVVNQIIEEADQTMRFPEMQARQVISRQIFQDRLSCSCPECIQKIQEGRNRPEEMPILIRESAPECQPNPANQQLKQCNCNTCYLKSENEARMRLLSSKPRFDNCSNFGLGPQVSNMIEKQRIISRDNIAVSDYEMMQQKLFVNSNRACCCSQCRYALKTSYFQY